MRKLVVFGMAVALTYLLTFVPGYQVFADDGEIIIQVAPATILIGTDEAGPGFVTVHAEIPFSAVDNAAFPELSVNDECITTARWIFADDRGELVAKFDSAVVKSALEGLEGDVILTLSGVRNDDTLYSGSDSVRVVQFPAPGDPPGKS